MVFIFDRRALTAHIGGNVCVSKVIDYGMTYSVGLMPVCVKLDVEIVCIFLFKYDFFF